MSGVHAQVRWSGRGWELRDLGSRNGTFVDGAPLGAGKACVLRDGTTVVFGHGDEAWELVDAAGPPIRVVCLEDGTSMPLVDQVIAIPSATEPVVCIYPSGDQWLLEYDGLTRPIQPGDTFTCEGRTMRFECPLALPHTPLSAERPCTLSSVGLSFQVSSDEEHVSLVLECPEGPRPLPPRSCYYLALTLARQRLDDARDGVADPGWVDIESLLRMIPDYHTKTHVNVDVHRLRRLLGAANVIDPGAIIERRAGQLRIGVERLHIQRKSSGV